MRTKRGRAVFGPVYFVRARCCLSTVTDIHEDEAKYN